MKKNYLPLLCFFLMLVTKADGQCPAGRYLNKIFDTVTVTTVTYSTPYSLMMDIYQPKGDTLAARPLIILAHGGSFVSGTRSDDTTVTKLDTNFAKRGYVTASIDYRLASSLDSMLFVSSATNAVVQAISDGKAAIRYFVKDAATTNTYRIDTNNIFIGGNSAGAVLYMHVGYIDSIGACPANIVTSMNANGGFEGNSGNAGYTTKSKAVINLAGALNETSFIGPGSIPSVNAQGTADAVVPYNCGNPLFGTCPVTLCGLGALEPMYAANHVYNMSYSFAGDNHVPWAYDTAKFNTVDSLVTKFLYNMVCTGIASVNEVNINGEVSLYPNPASESVNIKSAQAVNNVEVYDQTGRLVLCEDNIKRNDCEINTEHLSSGLYFVRIRFSDAAYTPVVKRLVIE